MYQYKAEIIAVIDGDTIEVDFDLGFGVWLRKQRIRLEGIDTPESRTTDKEEKIRGILSKEKLKEVLLKDKYIYVQTKLDPNEKFGRILAKISTPSGIEVNQWMISNYYAVAYQGENKEKVKELHLANAKMLKAKGELE
jgi:micrococcal nuclease